MITYHVAQWSAVFENTRSRRYQDLKWVAVPNSHDGEKYSRLIARPDGAIIFSAWILILQVASKCTPRGSLVRDDGTPLNSEALAFRTRAPEAWFTSALPYLSQVGWLISQVNDQQQLQLEGPHSDTLGTLKGPEKVTEEKRIGEDRKEEKRTGKVPIRVDFPFELRREDFQIAWDDWLTYRKQAGLKPYTEIGTKGQLSRLQQLGPQRSVAAIRNSIAQSYQGIFEEKGVQLNGRHATPPRKIDDLNEVAAKLESERRHA